MRATLSIWIALALAVAEAAGSAEMPWKQAGLEPRQAAGHLLDRFTFGARPGDLDRVLASGLEVWFEDQLEGRLPDPVLDRKLVGLEPLFVVEEEIALRYPGRGQILREAQEAGVLPPDFDPAPLADEGPDPALRARLFRFAAERGYRRERELIGTLLAQKVLRAVHSENQLHEVLTDFWFNHFNVSLADNQCRPYVLAYERDAIRPRVTAGFRDLLGATARHPAMLLYLDNAQSTAAQSDETTLERNLRSRTGRFGRGRERAFRGRPGDRRPSGLNENYARELLELHTLGVDGGYTQDDVVAVARAFTGWSVVRPAMLRDDDLRRRIDRAIRLDAGFLMQGAFLFRADAHDASAKVVLGHRLTSGRGMEDGLEVLDLLAAHPSTARHVARKIAVRFVSDEPPSSLIDRLAIRFEETGGNLKEVLWELVFAPEFWSADARRSKVKSPLELAASALRAIDAEVEHPVEIVEWIERMGQPLYAYQAPTGYPDTAEFWVGSGALLNRMNFGLSLAAGRVGGVRFELDSLLDGVEPASHGEALERYAAALLPVSDAVEVAGQLEPLVLAPDFDERLAAAAAEPPFAERSEAGDRVRGAWGRPVLDRKTTTPTTAEQVVGVLLGSPEFQRR